MYVLGDCRTGLSYPDPQTQGMMVAVAVLLRRVRQKPSGKKALEGKSYLTSFLDWALPRFLHFVPAYV